jgi:nucleotide-binding universal stress UspA family protein
MKNVILVPTDFTKVADCAINHAIVLAKKLGAEINLLHIVSKQNAIDATKEKLNKIAEEIRAKHGITTNGIARVGNIFDDIGDVAAEIGAKLIIMGTHGVKGIQHLTGSNAIKVITNSNVPFIVVQEKSITDGYEKIVLPMDMSKDTKQKVGSTVYLAKYFGSKVFVFAPKEDDEFLGNAVKRNVAFTESYLKEQGVPYEIKISEEKGNFTKLSIRYAAAINADLIAIVNDPDAAGMPDFLGSSDEQHILTNDPQIPVLCVNPIQVTVAGGVLGT